MTVGELKKLAPLADVYELNSESRYLMVAEHRQLSLDAIESLMRHQLAKEGVHMAILLVKDTEGIKIMDLEAKHEG